MLLDSFLILLGSVKDRAAFFLVKEAIKLKKVQHFKQKDAPPPIIVGLFLLKERKMVYF